MAPLSVAAQFTWRSMPLMPWPPGSFAAYNPAVAYDARRSVVVVVATEQVPALRSRTWEWNGTTWRSAMDLPVPRVGAQVAFDELRGETVLFGGIASGVARNDTWLWDGTAWQQASPSVSPPAGANFAMCFHALRSRVVMASGVLQGSTGFETWTWDGTTWERVQSSTVPPIGEVHAMSYDRARAVAVIVQPERGATALSTWELGADDWRRSSTPRLPSPRIHHALAYDEFCQRTILFGGGLPPTAPSVNDTWQWDGVVWQQLLLSPAPAARHIHGMAYDVARRTVVMLGGSNNGNPVDDGWEFAAPARGSPYGMGCAFAPLPALTLSADPPRLGRQTQLVLDHVPTLLHLDAIFLDAVPADVPLPLAGDPACRLYINALTLLVGVGIGDAQNRFRASLTLPADKALVGAVLFGQGFLIVGTPQLRLYSSNGVQLTLGL